MDVVFGIRDGDHIRFDVLGLACPDSDSDWYRSQLRVELGIQVESFRGSRTLVMFSDDFHRFRSSLQNLTSGAASKAWLETSDFLSIDVTADGDSYGIWMQLDALERDGEILLRDGGAENWEWCFVINALLFLH